MAKYDVFVEPATSTNTKGNKNLGDASIAILGGPEFGYNAVKVRKQKEQTKIQEWTQWKQWALDHKDFEAYRAEKIDTAREKRSVILRKLNDPKIQEELEPIIQELKLQGYINLIILGIGVIVVLFVFIL